MIVMEVFRSPHNTSSGYTASLTASSRLDFGVIPNGDAFSVPQHPEQPVGPRVIPVRGPAMGNLRAALATVPVHAVGNLGAALI